MYEAAVNRSSTVAAAPLAGAPTAAPGILSAGAAPAALNAY
jgi:hypothetical protein